MKNKKEKNILWFDEISHKDVPLVGGKNASLGEMFSKLKKDGVNVPNGFAITTTAYKYFLEESGLKEKIKKIFQGLDVNKTKDLQKRGAIVRNMVKKANIPQKLESEILESYRTLSKKYDRTGKLSDVAVRTSATAEDLPDASFAGQYWTYLNVRGEKELLRSVKNCFASLFTDRAIFYRAEKGFGQLDILLSLAVQKMVRSDLGASGVMFTLDTESGFPNVVVISSSYGLGEMIVQGEVTTDDFYVFKPTLSKGYKSIILKNLGSKKEKFVYGKGGKQGIKKVLVPEKERNIFSINDNDILTLAKWGVAIENHYSKESGRWTPMDIEWAKDGQSGQLFIVQARPETVHSSQKGNIYKEYKIEGTKKPILTGIAVGSKIGQGKVNLVKKPSELKNFKKGEVLVTKMTTPDWVPIMKKASAIITDEGGKTCHAAIVSRELGIPAIVGTEKATKLLKNGDEVTVDCSRGLNGRVFRGIINYSVKEYNLEKLPKIKTKIMVNIGAPEIAFKTSFLPVDGVGLAREEFIIGEKIKIHPLALYYYKEIENYNLTSALKKKLEINLTKEKAKKLAKKIKEMTIEHRDKKEYFIKELAEGIAQIGAAFWPKPVIVRFSDFKTNEYRQLIGGELFEPSEDNPMLGWRGASRYYDDKFKEAFIMECQAIKRVRDVFGLKNIKLMIPFCRTVEEGEKVIKIMEKAGLKRGKDGLEVYVMCEIPANVVLIKEFLNVFDGISIGSNDLTQLTLGIDRDSSHLQKIGNEKNEAVKDLIKKAISESNKRRKYCGICGQAPSDFPDFAEFLIKNKIQSISLNPDTVIKTIKNLSKIKK